jgi:hypothetical protein
VRRCATSQGVARWARSARRCRYPAQMSSPLGSALIVGTLPSVTTGLESSAEDLVARLTRGGGSEQAFADARQIVGVGETRNRTRRAVEQTVQLGLICFKRAHPSGTRCTGTPPTRWPVTGALVHDEDRTVLRRHDHQTPPRHNRRQISWSMPGAGHPARNPDRPHSLGRRQRLDQQTARTLRAGAGYAG